MTTIGVQRASVERRSFRQGWSDAHALSAVTVALAVLGTVLVGAASQVISLSLYGSPWAILARQGLWLGLGLLALLGFGRLDYHRLSGLSIPVLLVSFLGLMAVLAPHIGSKVTGSSRWIGVGAFSVQPSEIMKLALVLFFAQLIAKRQAAGAPIKLVVFPVVIVMCVAGALVLRQPDLGTTVVFGVIAFSMLFAAGVPGRVLSPIALVLGASVLGLSLSDPYRRQRLLSFLHPSVHSAGSGYQVLQSMLGVGSGGILGTGLGSGWVQWGYLPNAQTDFIYAVIAQELGLFGAVGVLLVIMVLCWIGIRIALRAPDRFGALLTVGIVAWIASETFINIGAVLGLLPVTGIPLPFLSYGGSSLVVTMAAIGIVRSVARASDQRRVSVT
jgi:cell division protein FtsW